MCVCTYMRARARVCMCVFVTYEDTNLYNDMGMKEKVIYEDIFSVPIFQKASKSYRVSYFFEKVKMHLVFCKG